MLSFAALTYCHCLLEFLKILNSSALSQDTTLLGPSAFVPGLPSACCPCPLVCFQLLLALYCIVSLTFLWSLHGDGYPAMSEGWWKVETGKARAGGAETDGCVIRWQVWASRRHDKYYPSIVPVVAWYSQTTVWRIRRLHLDSAEGQGWFPGSYQPQNAFSGQKLWKTLLMKQVKVKLLRLKQRWAPAVPPYWCPWISTVTDILCSWKASYSLEDNVEITDKLLSPQCPFTLWHTLIPWDIKRWGRRPAASQRT